MDEKLDFSLPEKKQKKPMILKLIVLLLLVLIGLIAYYIMTVTPNGISPVQVDSSFSSEQTKQLATQLAGRNLYERAAEVWRQYLLNPALSDTERATTLFQIGTLLEKAGRYAEAIEYFYRSEMTAKVSDLEPQINNHIADCFENLGMFSALRYELMDRTAFGQTEPAGSKIVAEIGAEKITEADLDALIEQSIENQLAPIAVYMTSQQYNEQKQAMLEQYKMPATKTQFLQSWLIQEVLYRDALQQQLMEQQDVQEVVKQATRQVLSEQIISRELSDKINITEADLQTYYQANKSKYVEPADANDPNSAPRQKSFEEVRSQVTSELVSGKSQDIQNDLIEKMMDKYNVIIHTSALAAKQEEAGEVEQE